MPDVRFTVEDHFGTADRGLCSGTISATLRGDFGPLSATGKSATAPIAEIFRIADGQIVEVWVYPDTLSIMQQFGLIPTSGGA
jgi:predicted ester cyclase